VQVMLRNLIQALRRDTPTSSDVLQERPYLVGPLRTPE